MNSLQNTLPEPIRIFQGTLATIPFTVRTIPTPIKCWFTAKSSLNVQSSNSDTQSAIQIEMTAGLLYLNGQPCTGNSTDGVITISDLTAGTITVTIHTAALSLLRPGLYLFDLKIRISDSPIDCQQLVQGMLEVRGVVTESM